MKKRLLIGLFQSVFALAALLFVAGCSEDDDPPANTDCPEGFTCLKGDITNQLTLDASKKYLLQGKVYVQSGGEIVIPAGTLIIGEKNSDGTLIINRGGKIDAQGTATNPIVFTSQGPVGFRNRGDWGGVVILGRGYTNGNANSVIEGLTASAGSDNGLYGPGSSAPAESESSGIMRYVRIEFAGIDLSLDNELNSLTMGAVGSGTEIDHIMVSYANDDAYEWFGGSNNHKYLIAYSTLDDDFDSDRGWNGKVQYGLVVRDPLQADVSGSRAFECSSNNASPAEHGGISRHSAPVFSNITVLGPRLFRLSVDGFYQAAVEINSSSNIKIYNSIITGFPTGIRWNGSGAESVVHGNVFAANTALTATSGSSTVPEEFTGTDGNIAEEDVQNIFGPFTAKNSSGDANNTIYLLSGLGRNPFQNAGSDFLAGAINLNASDSFFDNVAYKGAFGTTSGADWNFTSGWVNWDPINTEY
jgi:hypothetical protein